MSADTISPSLTPPNGAHFTTTIHNDTYPFISHSRHQGHNVFITGGSRGIGRAVALSFAKAGASAIALGEPDENFGNLAHDLIEAATTAGHKPPQLVLTQLDVTDSKSVSKAANIIREEFKGKLDALVNNAGFMTPAMTVIESDEDTWWRTFEVNLKGPYLVTKYFLPLLLEAEESLKTMVNVNSVASHNLRPMASAYGTSKLAVLKFTEFLLVEAQQQGLLAYSIHPGAIMTQLAEDGMPKDVLAVLNDKTDMAGDTVTWLTQERRVWLAGRYVSCTWDMQELLEKRTEIEENDLLKVRLKL